MKSKKRKELGQYIVSDPEICGGKPTFKGTRVRVQDVLYYVAKGKDWEWLTWNYDGNINHETIAEANRLTQILRFNLTSCQE